MITHIYCIDVLSKTRVNDYFRIQSDIRENIYEVFVQKHIDLTTPDIVYFNNKKSKGDAIDKSNISENS
ncbi:MAG: hypothetical protein WBL44_01315 [Nitrososphaeraceae archaeon]|jgi:hypothetical protein